MNATKKLHPMTALLNLLAAALAPYIEKQADALISDRLAGCEPIHADDIEGLDRAINREFQTCTDDLTIPADQIERLDRAIEDEVERIMGSDLDEAKQSISQMSSEQDQHRDALMRLGSDLEAAQHKIAKLERTVDQQARQLMVAVRSLRHVSNMTRSSRHGTKIA